MGGLLSKQAPQFFQLQKLRSLQQTPSKRYTFFRNGWMGLDGGGDSFADAGGCFWHGNVASGVENVYVYVRAGMCAELG